MKVALVAINAKYAHTNPAVRSIAVFARSNGIEHISFSEFTINQRTDFILSELYHLNSDVYLFSCYIWNIEIVKVLANELHKILPQAQMYAGGPEVSWHSTLFLQQNPAFRGIVRGEGERTTTDLLLYLSGQKRLDALAGLAVRCPDGSIASLPDATAVSMDTLPFAYEDLPQLHGKILYYESMRGCPFNCSYCISSIEQGVRFRSLDLVFADLMRFIHAGVRQVKFVDRTFNCNKSHAMAIWRFLQDHDNGHTNFHFELAAELMDDEMTGFLSSVRAGLFQFEIGVQSTNHQTLVAINRPANLEKLFKQVHNLSRAGNIHLHLDLIAGLPHEGWNTFEYSFNTVYRLHPAQFQLGFLKVLRGSAMETNAPAYGIVCRSQAPYEVLQTNWLSYGELQALKGVEEMLELYYNSGRFHFLITELCSRFPTPFALYHELSIFWKLKGCHIAPPDKTGYYQFLYDFMVHKKFPVTDKEKWLCKYDLILHEKPKKLPPFVDADLMPPYRKAVSDFYHNTNMAERYLPHLKGLSPKQAAHQTHIECFPFHPGTHHNQPVFLLFDYTRRDVLGQASVIRLPDSLFQIE